MAPAFFPALRDAVQTLHDAGATRVLILRAEGKHFCAGMALAHLRPRRPDAGHARHRRRAQAARVPDGACAA